MEHAVLTLGDTDTTVARGITALTNAQHTLDGRSSERPRAVLAFADLREHTRQSGKARLRAITSLAAVETKRHNGIRHLVFAVMLAPRHSSAFDRIASAIGARVHADLERDNARDVEVTFLDVSECGDVSALTERLLDRCDDPVGQHGVVVLDWDDIRDNSIRRAARDQYL
ncbi:hypothetical protein ACIQLK_02965 [Microbacterium sp. NPDC091382]|uniref:hypothetical protein n=1 Tax=Microbacterium sp. NPDC091382 TaxID=3364210 RepID=UPI00382DAC9C